MRFHVVSLPHSQTTLEYEACAFTAKVRKFCIMMKSIMGHEVYLYAGEYNDAPCDEHICCISEAERLESLGGKHYTAGDFNCSLPHWRKFNARVAGAIAERAGATDFICVIGGLAHKQIADALPHMMTVEFGIGYGGTFSKWRVWESYAWMHTCYGAENPRNPNGIDGKWFDAVVPGYFEAEKFPFSAEKDDYYLFVGRMIERKGVYVASDICKRAGVRLIMAGAGEHIPPYGEFVGHIGPERRGELMSRARALIMPTTYIEPFGNVAVEAQACGTPVICTDWGAMCETVIDGVTGFRCRTMAEFQSALDDVKSLEPHVIRNHAVANYSLPVIAKKYDRHFRRLGQLWSDGWYAIEDREASAA